MMLHEEQFERWWHNEGSGMVPFDNNDMWEHTHRVARIAWSNGGYCANERTREATQDLCSAIVDLKAGIKELTKQVFLRDEELEGCEVRYFTWRLPALAICAFVGLAFVMSRFL